MTRGSRTPSALRPVDQPYSGETKFDLVGWRAPASGEWGALDTIGEDLCEIFRQAAEADVRRQDGESEHASKTERMLLSLLDVMDAFERVLGRIHSKRDELDRQVKKWVGNFRTIHRMLSQILTDCGVSRIETVEDEFDPRWHTSTDILQDPSRPDGTIVGTSRAGYFWHGKVLRKAEVSVVRNVAE